MRTPSLIAVLIFALPACAGEETAQPAPLKWHEPIEVASGPAHQGFWRMNDSDFRYVDDPTVAFAPNGDIGVAWVDQSKKDVFFQRYGKDGQPKFEAPVNVSRSPDIFSWLPRVEMTGDGHVYLLWQEIVFSGGTHGGEIFFARSTDGGASFDEPKNLSNTTNGAGKGRLTSRYWRNGSLDLAAGPGDRLYAAWTEYQGPFRVRTSTDAGETWSNAVLVAGGEDQLPTRGPSLAIGPDGRIHLAWTVGEDLAADIHYASFEDDAETFTDPRAIAPSGAHADAPKLAVHADGTVHLAWMESPEGPLRQYRIRYTRREAGAEDFQQPKTISTPLPEGFDSASFPHLALDADSNPYILFDLFRSRSNRGTGLGMTWSHDQGANFTKPVTIPRGGEKAEGINGSLQGLLMDKLAVSPDGDIFAVNSTFDQGKASQVWLMRTQ